VGLLKNSTFPSSWLALNHSVKHTEAGSTFSKTAGTLTHEAYGPIREHDKGLRTQLGSFFNNPNLKFPLSLVTKGEGGIISKDLLFEITQGKPFTRQKIIGLGKKDGEIGVVDSV
jgi:hypothetical protein